MSIIEFLDQFIADVKDTGPVELIAVITGILSVYFSKKENILVFPIGLINTILYIYISFINDLPGEAAVNLYYTLVSLYGWWLWSRRKISDNSPVLKISASQKKEWVHQIAFFAAFFIAIYFSLIYLQKSFFEGAIPWADALASSSAFTAMWLMARKKVESWYWWILTNICSIPLYFVKGLELTSVYYCILLFMAISGLIAWKRKLKHAD